MKTFNFILLFMFLVSCSVDNIPTFNNKNNPFIIIKIEDIGDGYSKYYSNATNNYDQSDVLVVESCIVLPSRMFNIGDTITIK